MTAIANPFDPLFDALAEKVVERLAAQQPVTRRLVDVRGAAEILGLTIPAMKTKFARGQLRTTTGLLKSVDIDKTLRFEVGDLFEVMDLAKEEKRVRRFGVRK